MELKPYFPYLSPDKSFRLNELMDQTDEIIGVFSGLLLQVKQDIESTAKLEDVVLLLSQASVCKNSGFKESLRACKSLAKVFNLLTDFVSFFNYGLVKLLTHHFGSPNIKKKLKKYKKRFQKYSKRRVCECPKYAFGEAKESDNIYKIKTDKVLETFTVEELDKLEHEIRKILGHKLLRLLKVEDGCIELTFRVFNCNDFDISEDQKQALSDLGVLSVTFQDINIFISTLKHDPEKASSKFITMVMLTVEFILDWVLMRIMRVECED